MGCSERRATTYRRRRQGERGDGKARPSLRLRVARLIRPPQQHTRRCLSQRRRKPNGAHNPHCPSSTSTTSTDGTTHPAAPIDGWTKRLTIHALGGWACRERAHEAGLPAEIQVADDGRATAGRIGPLMYRGDIRGPVADACPGRHVPLRVDVGGDGHDGLLLKRGR